MQTNVCCLPAPPIGGLCDAPLDGGGGGPLGGGGGPIGGGGRPIGGGGRPIGGGGGRGVPLDWGGGLDEGGFLLDGGGPFLLGGGGGGPEPNGGGTGTLPLSGGGVSENEMKVYVKENISNNSSYKANLQFQIAFIDIGGWSGMHVNGSITLILDILPRSGALKFSTPPCFSTKS